MKNFFQKYIMDMSSRLHQQLVSLNQTEDGQEAIKDNEVTLRILEGNFDPMELTFFELSRFMGETDKVIAKAERLKKNRIDQTYRYFRQLYADTWSHFAGILGLRYFWNDEEHKGEFVLEGSIRLSFASSEHDALYCISILESLRQSGEIFKNEVTVRSQKGVTAPSTHGQTALMQAIDSNKSRLYALIGYDTTGQPQC